MDKVYSMKSLVEIANIDFTLITKVNAHVKTSGWGNRYLIGLVLFTVPFTLEQRQRCKTHIILNVLILFITFWLF